MKVTLVLSVPQHQSGASWSDLLRYIWIFNLTYVVALFPLQTLLTCCQIARSGRGCVILQCWAEKGPFPVLVACDSMIVIQQFPLIFNLYLKDARSIIMYPPHFLPDPYPSPLDPKMQLRNNQPSKQRKIWGRTLAGSMSTSLDL